MAFRIPGVASARVAHEARARAISYCAARRRSVFVRSPLATYKPLSMFEKSTTKTLRRKESHRNSDSDPVAARRPVSPRRHRGHGDLTEASGFSVHLRVLRVSVVKRALEFFLSLASHNTPATPAKRRLTFGNASVQNH